jgi:tagatose-1,6-bisphosphate aldolase
MCKTWQVVAALNRFISRLGKKGLHFFKLLKKTGKFKWIEEAKDAFESLKAYLISLSILTPPKKHKDMMLYIAATSMVVSAAIVVEREEEGHMYKVQQPVYYISEVLSDFKIRRSQRWFHPTKSDQYQALANFVVEWT